MYRVKITAYNNVDGGIYPRVAQHKFSCVAGFTGDAGLQSIVSQHEPGFNPTYRGSRTDITCTQRTGHVVVHNAVLNSASLSSRVRLEWFYLLLIL